MLASLSQPVHSQNARGWQLLFSNASFECGTSWLPCHLRLSTAYEACHLSAGELLANERCLSAASLFSDFDTYFHTCTGELCNLVTSQSEGAVGDQCMTMMLDGDQKVQPDLKDLPSPFIMSEHLDPLLQDLDPDETPGHVEGEQMFAWLPDLANAQVGMPKMCNKYQA
jgi:hypothetical protein